MRKQAGVSGSGRKFPYFKLQYWNQNTYAWVDVQKKFETEDDLNTYARSMFGSRDRLRLVLVEGRRNRSVFKNCEAFERNQPDSTGD